ncbi:M14 family metallopeptidase [Cellulomonas sp.]|uniref:M14 family metallopeptidase n=1 Tax=Cellulomonas sp. TaxID=40001 RepID=UPI0025840BD9|nr:M14 family metallopeptidase [Cellulomonas sp.]MCR6687865.1 M14 family metallopeptidase [Cellulomonas sp.]
MSARARHAATTGAALVLTMLVVPPSQAAPPQAVPLTTSVAGSAIDFPASYPFQPVLETVPDNPADASIARGALPYDEIAPTLNGFMAETDVVSAQVVGESANGWDIHLVTVTAPETAQETAQQARWRDEVKHDAAAAADDEELQAGYKRPIWFNGNIHGNEWEGTDASLNYIEWLVENENTPYVQDLLEHYRLYFTVSNNPDGRIVGTRANGQNLDLNRDFVTNQAAETRIVRDLTAFIQPIFFIDLHGYTGVLQIEPCGPPHGENYDYDLFIGHAYAAALQIEQDVVAAEIPGNTYRDTVTGATSTTKTDTSGIIIPFRDTPDGWDDWPPVFTAQYVAYQGAISYTAELPLGRVSNPETNKANSAVDTAVGFQVIDSTMDYVVENGDAILANQIEIFRRGAAGEPLRTLEVGLDPATIDGPTQWVELWDQGDANGHDLLTGARFPRGYVIPVGDGQRSDSDAAHLVDFLVTHGIEVSRTTAAFTSDGVTHPAGSYVVDMHQPLRGLANALLAAGSDISSWVPSMYDISAWSHGYLWGATVTPVGSTTDAELPVPTVPVTGATPPGGLPSAGGYLTFELDGVDDFAGLNALLVDDVPASLVGTGTVVLGNDTATYEAAQEVADEYGVAFRTTSGTELTGADVKPLDELQVAYTGTQDDRLTLSALGFAPEQLTLVSGATLQSAAVTLDDADVLWIGSALTVNPTTQPVAYAEVSDFVAAGKGVAGRGAAASTFATTWYDAQATAVTGNGSGNGVVRLDTVADGVLGALGTEHGFVYPAVSFALAETGHGRVEQTYGTDTLVSGHWRETTATNGPSYAAGRASVYSAELDSGARAVVFGTAVAFRGHPRGHFSEVATALYWTAPAATQDVLTAPVATTTTLALTAGSAVHGGTPASAVVKVTAASGTASRRGTVEIREDGRLVATGAVNAYGNAKVALPADLAVGEHPLVATYLPAPGAALVPSSSGAVTYTVTAAPATVTATATGSTYGTPAKVAVRVTSPAGTPTGTVRVTVGSSAPITATLVGGAVTVALPATLAVRTHAVTVAYAGDAVTGPAQASTSVTVARAATTTGLALSRAKVARGGAVTATAVVRVPSASSLTPVGVVKLRVDGTVVATRTLTAADRGRVTFTLPKGATSKRGARAVTVSFAGSSTLLSSVSAARTLTVV